VFFPFGSSDILTLMPKKKAQVKNIQELEKIANELRKLVIDMLLNAKSGHSAGSLGTAILSSGHICPIWYAALHKKGFFPKKELWTLRKIDSKLQGHPHYKSLPGIENTGGPLGQGLSLAAGIALAGKMDKKPYRVYCMTSDGELNEGQVWEAAMFAPNYKLNRLTWIIDRNNIQIDGYTENIMPLENLRNKLEAFNWFVLEIDGHNIEEIINACNMAKSVTQRPTAIIAHTIPGKGIDFMENKFEWHGKPPNKKEAVKALKQLRTLKGKIKNVYE